MFTAVSRIRPVRQPGLNWCQHPVSRPAAPQSAAAMQGVRVAPSIFFQPPRVQVADRAAGRVSIWLRAFCRARRTTDQATTHRGE